MKCSSGQGVRSVEGTWGGRLLVRRCRTQVLGLVQYSTCADLTGNA